MQQDIQKEAKLTTLLKGAMTMTQLGIEPATLH